MAKKYMRVVVLAGMITAILLGFVLYGQWPLWTGESIILDTEPVDPFDPFRGQYMTIFYEISSLQVPGDFDIAVGDRLYVLLEEDDLGVWRDISVSSDRPLSGDFIRGEVTRVDGSTIRLDYGIEQFFFERNAKMPTENITVEVRVASSGRAAMVGLRHNGEPVEIEYQEFDIRS